MHLADCNDGLVRYGQREREELIWMCLFKQQTNRTTTL